MLAFFEICISFMAILIFCAVYILRFQGESGAAPLAVTAATVVYFSLFAGFNQLFLGGCLYFILSIIALIWLWAARSKNKFEWKTFFSPGMVVFLVGSMAVMVLFAVKQPIFMEWDEFSFWGIAAKLVKETGQMYTVYQANLMVNTFTPGLIGWGYFFQFFGSTFLPWKVFAAYGILFFAVFSAVLSSLKRKNWMTAVPVAVLCFLTPFLFTVYHRIIYVSPMYMISYADVPLGMMLGGALALYFSAEKKNAKVIISVALALTAEALLKDAGFALALIGAGIVSFDLVFFEKKAGFAAFKEKLAQKLAWCITLFAGPAAAFFGWAWHMKVFMNINRMEIGGAQDMGAVQMVTTGIRELVSPEKSEQFLIAMTNMWNAFLKDSVTMFSLRIPGLHNSEGGAFVIPGSGLIVVGIVLFLLLLSFIAGDKKHKWRVAGFAAISTAGFAAYYIFIGFTYSYVFPLQNAIELRDYNRYIYPYYIAWFLAALAFVSIALKNKKQNHVGNAVLLLACGICLFRFNSFVQPQLSVVDVGESYFHSMREIGENTAQIKSITGEDANVFYISQQSDGREWFVQYYYFFPSELDYSFGGGTLSSEFEITARALLAPVWQTPIEPNELSEEVRQGVLQQNRSPVLADKFIGATLTPEVLCEYLTIKEIDYILIDQADQVLVDTYGFLFSDYLQGWFTGETSLYKVEGSGNNMRFTPVRIEVYA